MKKKLILLGIHLTVVALVLILTMVTLAWYTKSETADTSQVVITAEGLDQIGATDHPDNIINYKGETGLGGLGDPDAPYIATKVISVSYESKHADDAIICGLSNISVKLPDNAPNATDQAEDLSDVSSAFTFRVKVVEPVTDINGDTQYQTLGIFHSNEEGILVDEEGNPLYFQNETYFEKGEYNASKNSYVCSAMLNIELIFLDEESYAKDPADRTTPFRFSSYDYMGCTFSVNFMLGLDQGSTPSTPPAID